MKKGRIIGIIVIVVVLIFGMYGCNKRNTFNQLLKKDVAEATGNMEASYQRRMDLIDQLVATVKGQANFEQTTLTGIINARASATQVKLDMTDITPEALEKYKAAQGQLSQALGRLLMITENYPELRTNAAFSELRISIEGSENRISTAREIYNDKVTNFNTEINKIPGSLFAWGYKDLPIFKSDAGAEKAPKIDFGTAAPAK